MKFTNNEVKEKAKEIMAMYKDSECYLAPHIKGKMFPWTAKVCALKTAHRLFQELEPIDNVSAHNWLMVKQYIAVEM
jgi:hypothetical protein